MQKVFFIIPLKPLQILIIAILTIVNLAACAPVTLAPDESAATAPAQDVPTQVIINTLPAAERFQIGFSNTIISSDFRNQMIADLINVNGEYQSDGLTADLLFESADTDLAGQIQQIQNLIDKKVDAILVYPSDSEGLKPVLEQAVNQGILVLAVGVEISLPGVYNVGIDQAERSNQIAQWLADQMEGGGDIVMLHSNPASLTAALQKNSFESVLAKYPGIKVVSQAPVNLDPAVILDTSSSKAEMLELLRQFPEIRGVLAEDGAALGALQAIAESKPGKLSFLTGDPNCYYITLWRDVLTTMPDFRSITVANPPGATAPSALRIAVNLLQGKKPDPVKMGGSDGRTFIVPNISPVTLDNFEQQFFLQCMGKPASFQMDTIMTREAVQDFFLK